MAGNQLTFAKGASISKPPLFCGMNYPFWKVQMKIFMESINRGILSVLVNWYTIPTHVADNKIVEKPYESWSQEEIKKGEYDSKEMNIIHSSLNPNEVFRVSVGTIAKEIWDLIQVIDEGTQEVRRYIKRIWLFIEEEA